MSGAMETILEEAIRITEQDRADAYGDPLDGANRFAQILGALTGWDVKPEHFPLVQIATKLSRIGHASDHWHRDSYVDLAGYARVAEKIHEARGGE